MSIQKLTMTHPDGTVSKFTPGQIKIEQVASEASGEGVEGEPEATLGGVQGSPQGSNWCRFCGQYAYRDLICVKCWAASFETSITLTGLASQEMADALTPVIGEALRIGQSLDQASQAMARTLEQFESGLKRLAG